MIKDSRIAPILTEFVTRYPRQFGALFVVLVFEGLVAAGAVLALVPLADYLLDPTLTNPSRITRAALNFFAHFGIRPDFWILGLLFVASNLLKGLLDVATRYSIMRIKYDVCRGLFGDALATFFRARWEFFSAANQGRLLNTLNRELTTIGDALGHLATRLAQAIQLCIYLAVPIWLNATVTLAALGLAILLGSPLLLLQKLSYRLGKRTTETANVSMGMISEILSAARIILGFGRQDEARRRFLHAFDQHIHATLQSQSLRTAVDVLYQPAAMLAAIVALGVALQGAGPIAEMAALLFSLLRAFPLLGGLMSTNVTISNFLPSYEQLVALRTHANDLKEVEGTRIFTRLARGIELQGVSFTYPGRDTTLVDIDLFVRKGSMTALIGESGSGKSTITDLMLGLQLPASGEILLDGTPLREWKQNSFREKIGYVPQEPILFHASIRENLLWSYPQATEAELWGACRMANAEEFIRHLPQELDTVVGDRGVRLSGGQRQRIALARALLRKPELLILDEATSALDTESEKSIQTSINELARDTTILVIAHRLSTIVRADQVYVIAGGRIVEEGAYSRLRDKAGGVLASMVAAQRLLDPVGETR